MGIPVNCPNCNELFPEATSLYTHLRKNHNMASNDAKEIVFTEIKNYKEKTMKEAKKKKFW